MAGYALCEPETEIAGFTSELVALHVLPECQGRGLGRSLVSAAAEILASQGHQSVYLWTLADNPARSIYEKWGGEYLARRPWSNNVYFGTQIEEVAYGWPDIKVLIGLAMGAH